LICWQKSWGSIRARIFGLKKPLAEWVPRVLRSDPLIKGSANRPPALRRCALRGRNAKSPNARSSNADNDTGETRRGIAGAWYGCGQLLTARTRHDSGGVAGPMVQSFCWHQGAMDHRAGVEHGHPAKIFGKALGPVRLKASNASAAIRISRGRRQDLCLAAQTFVSGNAALHNRRGRCGPKIPRQVKRGSHSTKITAQGGRVTVDAGPCAKTADLSHGCLRTDDGYVFCRRRKKAMSPVQPLDENGRACPMRNSVTPAHTGVVECGYRPWSMPCPLRLSPPMTWAVAIKPLLVEGQVAGVASPKGLVMALMEEYIRPATENLHDYPDADHRDVPSDRER